MQPVLFEGGPGKEEMRGYLERLSRYYFLYSPLSISSLGGFLLI